MMVTMLANSLSGKKTFFFSLGDWERLLNTVLSEFVRERWTIARDAYV